MANFLVSSNGADCCQNGSPTAQEKKTTSGLASIKAVMNEV